MDAQKIGRRIKAAREAKKLTQEQLAELVDLSPLHMSGLERGHKPPKLETLVNIANTLHVSTDMLLQDVVVCATDGLASELSVAITKLKPKEQERIINAIRALTE